MTNKGKAPTKQDRAIKEFLENGGVINFMIAFKQFGSSRLSDNLYRLHQDGFVTYAERVDYVTAGGVEKHYFNYSTKKPEIMAAKHKTEKALKQEGSVSDIASKMKAIGQNVPVQVALFP